MEPEKGNSFLDPQGIECDVAKSEIDIPQVQSLIDRNLSAIVEICRRIEAEPKRAEKFLPNTETLPNGVPVRKEYFVRSLELEKLYVDLRLMGKSLDVLYSALWRKIKEPETPDEFVLHQKTTAELRKELKDSHDESRRLKQLFQDSPDNGELFQRVCLAQSRVGYIEEILKDRFDENPLSFSKDDES